MRKFLIIAVSALIACMPEPGWGIDADGVARFSRQIPGTDRRVPAAKATFADKVYFEYMINAEDGQYSLQLNVYDGEGREVLSSHRTLVVRRGRGGGAFSYGFDPSSDAPGTWWYVVALENNVVVSGSLNVDRQN